MNSDARFLSIYILNRFSIKKENLNKLRNNAFAKFNPSKINRARTIVLTNEVIRKKERLDMMITTISDRKIEYFNSTLKSILRVGFYEIIYDNSVPQFAIVDSSVKVTKKLISKKASGLTNAVLRKLIRTYNQDSKWFSPLKKRRQWWSIPIWIQERWESRFGKKGFELMAECMDNIPAIYIRVDQSRINCVSVVKLLKDLDIEAEVVIEPFLKVAKGLGKILSTKLFQTGQVSIQDVAAGNIVHLLELKEGDTVLDICAAPGTKSLFMSEIIGEGGNVHAFDISESRIKQGKNDIKRHGKKNIHWYKKDATCDEFPMSDKILIDAPCSGTGVLRKKPDIKWRRNSNDLAMLTKMQLSILNNVSKFLNLGGTLVYSTCSLEPEENWNIIIEFLKLKPNFQLMTKHSIIKDEWINNNGCFETFPHLHDVDGMFAAKLIRT